MNIYYQKAIELKYRGYNYIEISKAMGRKLAVETLRHLFAVDGKLYIPYLEYEAQMNKTSTEEAQTQYKKMLSWTWKLQTDLLQKAIMSKDFRLAWNIIQDINDRAGFVVVRKSEVNVKDEPTKTISSEEFFAELARLGIDKRTGLRVGSTPPTAD